MSQPIVVATRSNHKLEEVRTILGGSLRLHGQVRELIDLGSLGVEPAAEEDGIEVFDSFHENALAKARYFAERTGLPTIADDSGIVVHALDGEPGVHSKRFAGRTDLSGQALDNANNAHLLERLSGLPDHQRGAHYVCAATLVGAAAGSITSIGTCRGRILREPAGTGGFGYDPLFWIAELGRSFAELSAQEKHRVSHRGCAFRALAACM